MLSVQQGRVLGQRYRLEAPVAQGGMATVWSALDMTLGRRVAVKFLSADAGQKQVSVARFQREARLSASIQHRHVIQVHDFGTDEAGQHYMVMELLEGLPLDQRFDAAPPLSDGEIFGVIAEALEGLDAAHEKGIVHRDLKPSNLFLAREGLNACTKVIDFGISRSLYADEQRATQEGFIIGTPAYMSPEQARGRRDVDHRSDLYSLTVVLFEALTGQLPFDSENTGELLISIATDPAPGLLVHRPDLGPQLAAVVERGLKKNRDERFASAKAMREALVTAVMSGGATITRPMAVMRGPRLDSSGGIALPRSADYSPYAAPQSTSNLKLDTPSPFAALLEDPRRRMMLTAGLVLFAIIGFAIALYPRSRPAPVVIPHGEGAPPTTVVFGGDTPPPTPPPTPTTAPVPPPVEVPTATGASTASGEVIGGRVFDDAIEPVDEPRRRGLPRRRPRPTEGARESGGAESFRDYE